MPSREHTDFAESTEDIAPLTDTEKKARLDELRERLQAKRAAQSVQDKADAKRNEVRQQYPSPPPTALPPVIIY